MEAVLVFLGLVIIGVAFTVVAFAVAIKEVAPAAWKAVCDFIWKCVGR
jgi:hypothetical protein